MLCMCEHRKFKEIKNKCLSHASYLTETKFRGITFVYANNKHVNSKLNTSTTAVVGNISAN